MPITAHSLPPSNRNFTDMNATRSREVTGILQRLPQGGGFLRDAGRSFQAGPDDSWVSTKLIRQYGLVAGASVGGFVQAGPKGYQLTHVESVCGVTVEQFKERVRFDRLVPIDPRQRFRLGDNGNISMRIVEMLAPIGKGTRGLIVAPPKTGKTRLLEEIAGAIHAAEPNTRVIVLLIDERPEEVTHFHRRTSAEVLASSNDQSVQSHVNLAELTLAHIRCELECGRDIVVLLDSITRLGRAFNAYGSGVGRTMTGGLNARALEIPRRFFGLARKIENGGSVTVIATALVDTGSRMDELIFQEFKGTGNSEIALDRSLAEARIFPAVNISASGTRKEELLYNQEEMAWLHSLRRELARTDLKSAMQELLRLVGRTPTNDAMFQKVQLRR